MTASRSPSLHPRRLAVVAAAAVGAGALTLLPGAAPPAAAAALVPWADCEELLDHHRRELAHEVSPYGVGGSGPQLERGTEVQSLAGGAGAGATAESADSAFGAVGGGPTGTNVQEAGVDEPDTVKAVADLLLVSARGRLQVLRAGAQPELLSSLPLGDGGPAELLVEGDRVLALVSGWRPVGPGAPAPVDPPTVEPLPVDPPTVEPGPGAPEPLDPPTVEPLPTEPLPTEPLPVDPPAAPLPTEPLPVEPSAPVTDQPLPGAAPAQAPGGAAQSSADTSLPAPGTGVLSAVLVDLADPRAPEVLETLELDGRYVSARLVGGTVRLVTSSTPRVPVSSPSAPYGAAQERAALEQNRAAVERLTVAQVLPGAVRRDGAGQVQQAGPAVDCADVHRAASGPVGRGTLLVTTLRPSRGLAVLDSTAVTTDGDLVYASTDRLYVATGGWDGGRLPGGGPTTELHAFDTTAPARTPYLGSGAVRGYVYGRWALSSYEGHLRVATTLQPPWETGRQTSSSLTVLAERAEGLVETGRVDGLGPDEQIYAVRYFGDLATVVTFRQTDPLYVLDLADPTDPRVLGELKIPGFSTYLHPVGGDRLLGIGSDADAQGRVTGFQVSLFDLADLSSPVQVDRLSLGEGWSAAQEDSRAVSYDPSRGLLALPFSDSRGRASALGVVVDGDHLREAGRLPVGHEHLQRALLHDGRVLAVSDGGVVVADAATWEVTGTTRLAG